MKLKALVIIGAIASSIVALAPAASAAPTITSFTPGQGPVGTTLTIKGSGFTGKDGICTDTTIRIAGVSAPCTYGNHSTLHTIVPAGALSGPITVTNDTGTAASATPYIVSVTDLPYKTIPNGTQLLMDVYYAPGAGRHPVLMFVHGGAFKWGSKISHIDYIRSMAAAGFVVFSPDFRLACKTTNPDAVNPALCGNEAPEMLQDVNDALAWARDHAARFGGDGDRLGLLGGSAGGTLAAYLATTRRAVKAVVTWSGLQDLPAVADTRAVQDFVGCKYEIPECAPLWVKYSAITYADSGDAAAFMVGSSNDTIDVFREQNTSYQTYLSAGRTVEWHLVRHSDCHGFVCAKDNPDLWAEALAFLAARLS